MIDLPLNGRNILNLSALVPGVFLVRQMTGIADTFTANRFIVNGGQESTSDLLLDGVSATVSHNISTIPAVRRDLVRFSLELKTRFSGGSPKSIQPTTRQA